MPFTLAAVLALWAWLGAPRARLMGPAIVYGLLHPLHAGNVLYNHGGGMVGARVVVTFVAFSILAVATFAERRGRRLVAPE